MKTAVVFDLDGTLLNTLEDLHDSMNHCLRERGYPERSLAEIREFVGNGIPKLVERSLPAAVTPEVAAECTQAMLLYYEAHSDIKTAPYAGVVELLGVLREQNVKTAVVTNKEQDIAASLCRDKFAGRVDAVIGAREDIPAKPAPQGVWEALRALEVTAREAIFVGDTDVDILTAKNAGLESIGVLWGFRDKQVLEQAGADYFADSAEELQRIIFEND